MRFIADENPRAAAGAHGARSFSARQPEDRRRRHRHQGQDLRSSRSCARSGRRWRKAGAAWARSAWSTPKGEMPLDAHDARSRSRCTPAGAAEAGRRRSSGAGGLQPRARSVSSRRRGDRGGGLHQHHPRSYGLSRRLRGIPRRQAAPVHAKWCSEGGVAVVNADAAHAERFHRCGAARAGLSVLTVGENGETLKLVRRAAACGRPDARRRIMTDSTLQNRVAAGRRIPGLECAGRGRSRDRARANPPEKVFAALAHLKGAPGRLEKVAYAASARRSMSITPIRRTRWKRC